MDDNERDELYKRYGFTQPTTDHLDEDALVDEYQRTEVLHQDLEDGDYDNLTPGGSGGGCWWALVIIILTVLFVLFALWFFWQDLSIGVWMFENRY